MTYLENKSSIFAMRCRYEPNTDYTYNYGPGALPIGIRNEPLRGSTQCGIFNINTHDWSDIKDFNYLKWSNTQNSFDCSVCYDNDDVIYVYDHALWNNYTSKCDLNKNKWYTISNGKAIGDSELIAFWYSDSMLYGLTYPARFARRNIPNTRYQLVTLDLRDKDRKWNVNSVDFDGLKKDNTMSYSFFR